MSISTQSAKAKGRRLQNDIRDKLVALFPHLDGHIKSCSMGSYGEDIILSPTAREAIPFSIEAKSYSSFAVYKFIDQAAKQKTGEPLVVIKADRRKPLAVVDLDVFLGLLEAVNGKR